MLTYFFLISVLLAALKIFRPRYFVYGLILANLGFLFISQNIFALMAIGLVLLVFMFSAQKSKLTMFLTILSLVAIYFFSKITGSNIGLAFIVLPLIGLLLETAASPTLTTLSPKKLLATGVMFASSISGPVISISKLNENLEKSEFIGQRQFLFGILQTLLGLVKFLGSTHVSEVFDFESKMTLMQSFDLWISTIVYSIYFYLNFSGASDIAIGIGKIMGLDLPDNFKLPFLATDVHDHWKKWNASLYNWFNQYVFFPLNILIKRKIKSIWVTYGVLILVVIVIGLMHEISMAYLVWGALNAFLIIITPRIFNFLKKNNKSLWISIVLTFLLTSLLRLFTLKLELGQILQLYPALLKNTKTTGLTLLPELLVLLLITGVFHLFDKHLLESRKYLLLNKVFWSLCMVLIFICLVFSQKEAAFSYGSF